jgi:2-keto-4-pentenoate hydratase/2-oxohepta-3-ene-1,7-dioic acid hydratase in catechol pathway
MALGFAFLTYEGSRGARAGLKVGEAIYDAADATGNAGDASVLAILGDWDAAKARLAAAAKKVDAARAVRDAKIVEPIRYPGAIYCAGANYTDHVAEMAVAQNIPLDPDPHTLGLNAWHFMKPPRSVVGPDAVVPLPHGAKKIDWEVELVAVIGRRTRGATLANALDSVAGYTIANDLSARDLGTRVPIAAGSPFRYDWLAHKGFDGACPIGPWIVPAEDVGDPQDLGLELSVNGVVKQKSSTKNMIFTTAEQIVALSERATLYPGDIVLTGTPAGVGTPRNEFLKPGDRVVIRIEKLGELVNTMA